MARPGPSAGLVGSLVGSPVGRVRVCGQRKLVSLRGCAVLRWRVKRNLRTRRAPRLRRGGQDAAGPVLRAGGRLRCRSLRQLGGSGRRRRAPAVYEASPEVQCAEPSGSSHAWSPRASRCSLSRVGTSPGPRDGGVWPRVGRSRVRLNLLLMNLSQKLRDLQLEAVSARARGRALSASEGWGLGEWKSEGRGGICVFKNKP